MTVTNSRGTSFATIFQRVVVYSIMLMLVPLVLYPKTFGFPSMDLNPAVGLLEWAFYIGVLSLVTTEMPFSTRVVAAGFTVVFRLLIAAASGCLVGWFHSRPMPQTMVEIMWSYPLSLLPQTLTAAVITGPLWEYLMSAKPAKRRIRTATHPTIVSPAVSVSSKRAHTASASRVTSTGQIPGLETSFDDAVSYVGEYAGVRLCWIVDQDGLPVAVWQRQMYTGDADFWAPVSIDMIEYHRRRLSFAGEQCLPDRLELRTNQGRLVVESVKDLWLGVLTDPDADDLISVRITRARDMIARHLNAEGGTTVSAGEVQYV